MTEPDQGESAQQAPTPDGELLELLRARDGDALRRLVERFSGELTRAAWLFLGDAHMAEDAVQDAFIAAWDGAKRTNIGTPLRAWIFGVLFNTCRKKLRKRFFIVRWERTAAAQRPEIGLDTAAGADSEEGDERLEALRRALARLGQDERAVIVLRYERNLSVAETAQALDIPEGTVKSRTHNALDELKRLMGVQAGGYAANGREPSFPRRRESRR